MSSTCTGIASNLIHNSRSQSRHSFVTALKHNTQTYIWDRAPTMNEILEDTKNADIFKDKYEHQKWSNYYNNGLNLCYKYIPQEAGVTECLLSPLNQPFLHESKCVTDILVQKGNYQMNCKWARAIVHSVIDTFIFVQLSFPRDRSEFMEMLMRWMRDGWFVYVFYLFVCLFV